jgi:hypothetical protein
MLVRSCGTPDPAPCGYCFGAGADVCRVRSVEVVQQIVHRAGADRTDGQPAVVVDVSAVVTIPAVFGEKIEGA